MPKETELGVRNMHMAMHAGGAPRDTGKDGLLGQGSSKESTLDSITVFVTKNWIVIAVSVVVVFVIALSIGLSAGKKSSSGTQGSNGVQINNRAEYGDTVLAYQKTTLCEMALIGNVANIMGWTCYNGQPLDSDICGWKGIVCDNDGYILSLTMSTYDAGFASTIPTTMGYLSALTYLSMSSYPYYGKIYGVIPTTIAYLTNLRELHFSRGVLSGTLPSEIGYLKNLQVLALHRNKISGAFPYTISSLTALTALSVSNNDFSGTLPTIVGNLGNLVTLQLWNNKMTGAIPSSLGLLSKIEDLYISNNYFSGTVPSSLCLPPRLTSLQFNNKGITCYANCLIDLVQRSQQGQAGGQQGQVLPCQDTGVDCCGQGGQQKN